MTHWAGAAQGAVAALACALFAWDAFAERRADPRPAGTARSGARRVAAGRARKGRQVDPSHDRGRRLRSALLVALAGLAALGGWNFLTFRTGQYVHAWDIYHHYITAKYFRELGYLRLYECAAAADLEDGAVADPSALMYRNLVTNRLESAAPIVSDPSRCTRHFKPARWRIFKSDIAWFRGALGPNLWEKAQWDHGYNASPVWSLMGGVLAALVPASDGGILFLSLLDPLLLAAMFASIGWAFGTRPLCVALLFWGTNYPGAFEWMGGAFLRQDWLALTILAIGLVRKGRPFLGGAALATASLLRLAPLLVGGGLLLRALAGAARRRPGALSGALRTALGALAATAILVPAATLYGGDAQAWRDFQDRLRLQRHSPVIINLGLQTIVEYDHATRLEVTGDKTARYPIERWEKEREWIRERRAPIFWIAALVCLAPVAFAAARASEDWVALALGIGAIPILLDLPCYYASILLGLGLLAAQRPAWAAAMCGLSLFTSLAPLLWTWFDDIFFWSSVGVVAWVVGLAVAWSLRDRSA